MIRIGTSGYSYEDWRGPFYGRDLPSRDFLAHYATRFDTCEINFSYYRMPEARTLAGMLERTAGRVTFSIKLPRTLTHDRPEDPGPEARRFREALSPWIEGGVLGAVLAQLPHGFGPGARSQAWLDRLLGALEGLPRVVELRHGGWISQDTFDHLRAAGAGFCCVDEPALPGLVPPLGVVTAEPAYVRFHGRNAERWYDHAEAWERYDHAYSDDELAEWVPRIRRMATRARQTFVYFNNHFQAKAISAAERLRELLAGP